MITSGVGRERRIRRLIYRHGGGTRRTNNLDGLLPEVRAQLEDEIPLHLDEAILLAAIPDSEKWCCLTTERLLWKTDLGLTSLSWEEVLGAQLPDETWDRGLRGEQDKMDIDQLEIVTHSGARHMVSLEKGPPFFLVWSGIVALANLPAEGPPGGRF